MKLESSKKNIDRTEVRRSGGEKKVLGRLISN